MASFCVGLQMMLTFVKMPIRRPSAAARARTSRTVSVSGSIAVATAGALVGFAGGEASAFARARPLLEQLCRRVEHVGPLGAGARLKLAANLLLVVFWQSLGESLSLVDVSSADVERTLDLLADSNIGASILRTRGPEIVAAVKGAPSGKPAFDVDTMRKDLRYMAQEAKERGGSVPLVDRTLECLDRAARDGNGRLDGVNYPAYWVERQRAAETRRPTS